MSTPQIWEFIEWPSGGAWALKRLSVFLERSRDVLLYLNIEMAAGDWSIMPKVIFMIAAHAHRVHSLRFLGPPELQLRLLATAQGLPALRYCYLRDSFSSAYYTIEPIPSSPELSAALKSGSHDPLALEKFHANGRWAHSLFKRIDVKALRELNLLGVWISPESIHCLIHCSVLETLDITTHKLRIPDPIALPTVRRLLIRGEPQDLGIFFSSLPVLEHLSIMNGRYLVSWNESVDSPYLQKALNAMSNAGSASILLHPLPNLPGLLSLTMDSSTSDETLEVLHSSSIVKRIHLHGTANFSPILRFIAFNECKEKDQDGDDLMTPETSHFRDLDLLRLWAADEDPLSQGTPSEYLAQNEDVPGVVRSLAHLLKTRPALHVEVGFANQRWPMGSFRELETQYGDRINIRYKSSEERDWYEIARLGYIPLPETFKG